MIMITKASYDNMLRLLPLSVLQVKQNDSDAIS